VQVDFPIGVLETRVTSDPSSLAARAALSPAPPPPIIRISVLRIFMKYYFPSSIFSNYQHRDFFIRRKNGKQMKNDLHFALLILHYATRTP
jgi:hypothetical protein